jgi:hypothetical protein
MYWPFTVPIMLIMFCQWYATVGSDSALVNHQAHVKYSQLATNKCPSIYCVKKSNTKQIIPQVHPSTVYRQGIAPTSKAAKGTYNLRGLRSPWFRCNRRIAPNIARKVLPTPSWTWQSYPTPYKGWGAWIKKWCFCSRQRTGNMQPNATAKRACTSEPHRRSHL